MRTCADTRGSCRTAPVHRAFTRSAPERPTVAFITNSIEHGAPTSPSPRLDIRPEGNEFLVDGVRVPLTRREFQLLDVLLASRDRVVTRERLYRAVWRRPLSHRNRSVDVFVRKLRAKLQDASPGWNYIHTHFGVGYRFEPEAAVVRGRPSSTSVRHIQAGAPGA